MKITIRVAANTTGIEGAAKLLESANWESLPIVLATMRDKGLKLESEYETDGFDDRDRRLTGHGDTFGAFLEALSQGHFIRLAFRAKDEVKAESWASDGTLAGMWFELHVSDGSELDGVLLAGVVYETLFDGQRDSEDFRTNLRAYGLMK